MEKISTLFKKNPKNLGRVINEVNPKNIWVFEGEGIPTRKFDGTATAIINGQLYKRYDAKINKKTGKRKVPPPDSIPCQEPDIITGHQPFWIPCKRDDQNNKYHFEAFDKLVSENLADDGTYELLGEKVQGNPEKIKGHELILHGVIVLELKDFSFESIKEYLTKHDIEGIVFHHKTDDRMCKIRKSDFGIKR